MLHVDRSRVQRARAGKRPTQTDRSALTSGLLLAWLLTAASCVTPSSFGGPLAIRNQHPVQLVALRMDPVHPDTTAEGTAALSFDLSYSSLFLRDSDMTSGNAFYMDGEILRAGLKSRYGLTDRVEAFFELPVAYASGGFLDDFLQNWHDTFGLRSAGQENYPKGLFEVRGEYLGNTVYQMEANSLELLDIPIGATWQLLRATEKMPASFSVRGAIELPTGDQSAGYGNGGVDYSAGVLGAVHAGAFSFTGHVGYTWVATPRRARALNFDFKNVTSHGIAIEAALTQQTSVVLQYEVDEAVLRNLRGVSTEVDQGMGWIGLRTRWDDGTSLVFGFGEDLTLNSPPDFTAFLGYTLVLGARR